MSQGPDQVLDVDKAASLNHSLVNHIQGIQGFGRVQRGGGGSAGVLKLCLIYKEHMGKQAELTVFKESCAKLVKY